MTLEHAAVTETSLMLHYEPDPVHMDRVIDKGNATPKADARHPVRNGDVPDHSGLATPAGAASSSPRRASPRLRISAPPSSPTDLRHSTITMHPGLLPE